MNIGQLLPHHARYKPDQLAVVFNQHRLTYREFNERVNRTAHALLELGLKKGDKVATVLSNSLELLEIYWAVAKTGLVVVPLNTLLRGQGLTSLINDSDAAALITHQAMVQHLNPLKEALPNLSEDRYILIDSNMTPGYRGYHDLTAHTKITEPPDASIQPGDLYNIIYSSGTTGLPKGIMHTHFIRAMYGLTSSAGYRITPESVILHTGSIVFNGAFLTLMAAFYQGTTYILHPSFDIERMIETIHSEKVTHIMMVPSQIVAMLHAPGFDPEKLRSLQMILSLGAPLHAEHKRELNRQLPGVFHELYGLTEGFATVLDKTMYEAKPESVGIPTAFSEMKIVDENGRELGPGEVGEIVGRGPLLMTGYYKRPDLTANAVRDGWLYSGDLGYVDEDGFLYLVDRKKDMIISGGINVYPRDIEEIIVQHPAVAEAAVFGVPDERWGEAAVAAVLLKDPAGISAEALRDWVNERVHARYQKVREVLIREDFPRSMAGKTLKRVMRGEYTKGQP